MSKSKRKIDFIVIGAMKSATTSLFKYLSVHPQVYMTPGKEADFFSDNTNYSRGFDWYLDNYFKNLDKGVMIGEASPQYMCYDYVPKRIYKNLPNIKLIVILRNPIDRAYSQYLMAKRRKIEKRSFYKCLSDYLNSKDKEKKIDNINIKYFSLGNYGEILVNFLNYFSENKIKVVFFEDLIKNPLEITREIYKFLDVNSDFYSNIIGRKYHQSGEKRFPWLEKLLFKIKKYVKIFLPFKLRRKLMFWFETQGNVVPGKEQDLSASIRQRLVEFYQHDVDLLKNSFNINPPWDEFK